MNVSSRNLEVVNSTSITKRSITLKIPNYRHTFVMGNQVVIISGAPGVSVDFITDLDPKKIRSMFIDTRNVVCVGTRLFYARQNIIHEMRGESSLTRQACTLPNTFTDNILVACFETQFGDAFTLVAKEEGKDIIYVIGRRSNIHFTRMVIPDNIKSAIHFDYHSQSNRYVLYKSFLFLTTFTKDKMYTISINGTAKIVSTVDRACHLVHNGKDVNFKISPYIIGSNSLRLLLVGEEYIAIRSMVPIYESIIKSEEGSDIEVTPSEIFKLPHEKFEIVEAPFYTDKRVITVKSKEKLDDAKQTILVEITELLNS